MTDFPEIKKLADTVQTIVNLAEGIKGYNNEQLNYAEDKLRNEFQVIEAHLFHVGQEVYAAAQERRAILRREHILNIDKILASNEEKVEEKKEEAPKPKKTTKKGKK